MNVPASGPGRELAPAEGRRGTLSAALATANVSYGHPLAGELAAKLADPRTRVVVTGQQAGLLGGPILTVVKALAAVAWARRIEARTGDPAVAVFWMATEDHDWTEVARVRAAGPAPTGPGPGAIPAAGLVSLDLGPDPAPLSPVGLRAIGPTLPGLMASVEASLGSPWARQRFLELATATRPEARFGEAFGRLMVAVLGARCPLLLDALLPEVKAAQRDVLRRVVDRRVEVDRALGEAEASLRAAGREPQVAPQPGVSPLFLLRGHARRRIAWARDADGTIDFDRFVLRGAAPSARGGDDGAGPGLPQAEPVEVLHRTIEENPGVVSAGVLARPAVQDAILGTSLQVLGPGEMAYMDQADALYWVLGVDRPDRVRRPTTMTLDAGALAKAQESGFRLETDLEDLLGRSPGAVVETVGRIVRRQADGGDATGAPPVAAARATVESALQTLRGAALAVDPTLEKPFEKTVETVRRAFESFEGRLAAAEARRHETLLRRLERIREMGLPGGEPQERVLTVAPAAARFGPEWIDRMEAALDAVDLDPERRAIVVVGGTPLPAAPREAPAMRGAAAGPEEGSRGT